MAFHLSNNNVNDNTVQFLDDTVSELDLIKAEAAEYAYLKAATAADIEAIFTITSITKGGGSMYGNQWQLEIAIREDSVEDYDLGIGDDQQVIMSLPTGRKRDALFTKLLNEKRLPMSNCYIAKIEIAGNPNGYYELMQLPKSHPLYRVPEITLPASRVQPVSATIVPRKKSNSKLVRSSLLTRQNETGNVPDQDDDAS